MSTIFHRAGSANPQAVETEKPKSVFHQMSATPSETPLQEKPISIFHQQQAVPQEITASNDMTSEEFKKLPFEERARISKETAEHKQQEVDMAYTSGLIPGFEQIVERAQKAGIVPPKTIKPEQEIPLQIAGMMNPISALGFTARGIAKGAQLFFPASRLGRGIATIGGTIAAGSAFKAVEQVAAGKMPTGKEVAKSGLMWGAIESAIQLIPIIGKLSKNIINTAKKAKPQSVEEVANAIDNSIEEQLVKLEKQAQIKAKPSEVVPVEPEISLDKSIEKEPITSESTAHESFFDKTRKRLGLDKSELNKESWELVRDTLGEKWARDYKAHIQWQHDFTVKFPNKSERSDMIFYREKPELVGGKRTEKGTGNPFVNKEESFADMEKRMSPEAKKFVDENLDQHFKNMLEEFNKSPYTKNISPRDFLEDMYIPHFYDGNAGKAAKLLSKGFQTKNPLSNMRSFLTFNHALKEAGLTPKYKDISELMTAYDSLMVRLRANAELAGQIRELEKRTGQKLILRSGNVRYEQAKKDGWIPFEDPYLRRTVTAIGKDGKPIYTTTTAPALVHPDVAPSLAGVFVKNFKSTPRGFFGKIGQGIGSTAKTIDNFIKRFRLQFSPFHYNSLLESYRAARGTPGFIKDIFTGNNFMKHIDGIMKDPGIMDEMLRAGLSVHPPVSDTGLEYGKSAMDKLIRHMQLKGGPYQKMANAAEKAGEPFKRFNNYLFGKFQPRLKVASYLAYKDRILNDYIKRGVNVSPELNTQINRAVARIVNNQFGGQRWELIAGLNNPRSRQILENGIAYPDWTISAIREVQDTMSKDPIVKKYARGYMGRYIAQIFTTAQLANLATTGFYNKKDGSIGWDWTRAHIALKNEDPTKSKVSIQLPDIYITIGGRKINIGRDEKGRHLYVHQGKKLHEILKYFKDPVQEIFSKSRPGIQFAVEQMTGYQPSLKHAYPVEPGWKGGQFVPWEGTEYPSWDNMKLRAKHASELLVPFSISGAGSKGIGPYIASGAGALPVSKGASTYSMEQYLRDAEIRGDHKRFEQYIDVLRKEGYEESSLKRLRTKVKRAVAKEKREAAD